ncbi:uncharacterized protein LOC131078484 [Cryptomeria japonica]|uniref:uncharacterized protein LOC131078484 n=1 Tax=Cryptomeria japonica TaxID=3369 RepID=UPI0027DA7F1D|nr:uncharacterized protein LOC131078484 [Cryptomeria japonica]
MESLWRKCLSSASKNCLNYLTSPVLQPLNQPTLLTRGAATAKGKVQPKKKSVVRKKNAKPAKASSGAGSQQSQRIKATVQACMNAPTPLRYLKMKDRLREMEREKLGLISKQRQRELDMEKEKKKQEKKEKAITDEREELDVVKLGLFHKDEIEIPSFELTVEEGNRLAKEYSRLQMRNLRKTQAEETIRLKLKNEAIAALPLHLREAALVPDFTPFPLNRHRAYLTPPIEGYDQKLKDTAKQKAEKRYR